MDFILYRVFPLILIHLQKVKIVLRGPEITWFVNQFGTSQIFSSLNMDFILSLWIRNHPELIKSVFRETL